VTNASITPASPETREHALRLLVTQLGEALAVCIERLERSGMEPLDPRGFLARLLVQAKREGR
jgi:hypothetical protein